MYYLRRLILAALCSFLSEIGISKSLAREIGSRNITVNCVAPGFISTDMTEALTQEQRGKLVEQIPLDAWGKWLMSLPQWFFWLGLARLTLPARRCM